MTIIRLSTIRRNGRSVITDANSTSDFAVYYRQRQKRKRAAKARAAYHARKA